MTNLKVLENEFERQEAVRIANEQGMDLENILSFYSARERRILAEAAVQERQISDETKAVRIQNITDIFTLVGDIAGRINEVWQASLDKRNQEIENEAESRRLAVENSTLTEEQRAEAIEKIDAETAAKKAKLQRENAVREKAAALFGIAINTALAAVKALPNIPLSLVIAGLGLAEGIAVATTPIPLAEGALVRSDPGKGVIAQVGEGKQDEIVLPMKTGAIELANNIVGKMTALGSDIPRRAVPNIIEQHYHIGTLIADEFGLKQLSKKLNKYTVAENQRTGVSIA